MATPRTAVFEFDPRDAEDGDNLGRLREDRPIFLYGIFWTAISIRFTSKGTAMVTLKAGRDG